MKRRDSIFTLLAIGAALGARAVRVQAQLAGRPYRIALLPDFPPNWNGLLKLFVETLRESGRIEGRDFVLYRSGIIYGQDIDRAVAQVVGEKPDLIFAVNTGYVVAAHRLTKTIPIVMWASGLPVEAGVADSLARPGRNVTGMAGYADTRLVGKHLELLREAKSAVKRVGVLWDYVPPFHPRAEIDEAHRQYRSAARALNLEVRIYEIASPDQVDATLGKVEVDRMDALVITTGAPLFPHRKRVMEFTVGRRLPTLSDYHWPGVEPQPLLRYAPSNSVLIRQATAYVDRILWGGAKPGDLPIQTPVRFQPVVNLRAARAIGLALPQSLLDRAETIGE